jgi:hypothetical protein
MANTFQLIASATVGSTAVATIDFTSIPSTYTDLCLKLSARLDDPGTYFYIYIGFNGTTYNTATKYIQGAGSGTPNSGTDSTGYVGIVDSAGATANTFSNNEIYIPNYAGSTNKSISVDGTMETNATASYMHLVSGLWSNTAAINQVTLKTAGANKFLQYTTAYLYGIKNS